uniref:Agglutinin domain-containing protein n=1 Tax=Davidia involucrata TaxID=16924 RepID=A0A5B7BBW4_DAVIN
MGLPRFVVVKSNYNNKYLQFKKEDVEVHGFLQFSGEEVFSPYAKHEVQTAKCGKGLVNIRCCYNNKYWRRWSPSHYWIIAGADEPEEDKSKWSCTLFEPVYLWHVRFRHVQLDHFSCLWRLGKDNEYDSCLFGGSKFSNKDKLDAYTIIDWESLFILPKHVAFKGDNGKYLSARQIEGHPHPYLQFASTSCDIKSDPTVGNQVFITGNGSVRIKSDHLGKFWRCSPDNWIWADSDHDHTTTSSNNSDSDSDTLFWPIKVNNNVVALRNLRNNNFCSRSKGGKTSCLNAAVPTISKEARLQVEELVLSRNIYEVNYHIKDARIYNQSVVTLANRNAVNKTQNPKTVQVKLPYTEKTSWTWNASISLKLGTKTNLKTGVPLIGDQKIVEISAEFNGEYQWGNTEDSTKAVEKVYEVADVPPMSQVKVSLLATKASCDVPFSYSQCDTLTNGEEITYTMDDGVYTRINCFDFNYETKPENL